MITEIRMKQEILFPVTFQGSKGWTLKKQNRKSTDTFELWYWTRFLTIPWIAKKTKQNKKAGTEQINSEFLCKAQFTNLKQAYFGNIIDLWRSLLCQERWKEREGNEREDEYKQQDGLTQLQEQWMH